MSPTLLRRSFIAALLLPLALAAPSSWAATAGSGRSASEARELAPFRAIAVRGPIRLVLRQAAAQSVQVQADDNLLALIETVVEDGRGGPTLRVGIRRGESIRPRSDIVVDVGVAQLERIDSAGAGSVEVDGLSGPALALSLSGSVDARLRGLALDRLSLRIAGSGDIAAAGRADRLELSIAGSGDVRAQALQAQDVSVRIAGSGDASVDAGRSLEVSIAGSGDVAYTGNASIKSSVAGSGSIVRR